MLYQLIAILLFLLALVAIYISVRMLSNKKWIAGFLRGTLGVFLLLFTALAALTGVDFLSYKSAKSGEAFVTLSLRKREGNTYFVELQESSGALHKLEVEGQQWQLQVRMFSWPPLLSTVGLGAGYQLESISGRFIELQLDNLVGGKPPQPLHSDGLIDAWAFLNAHPAVVPFLTAHTATPGFIPMADGAIYDVKAEGPNVTAVPMNDAAKNALKAW